MRYRGDFGARQSSSEEAQASAGLRIEELQAVSEEHFAERRRPGRRDSYVIFSAPWIREIVSVPSNRPVKPVYVRHS